MSEETSGKIVTFYSYKGGSGRTMALANLAWILAAAGRRVLMVDWDLESPGLHRFFEPFLDAAAIAENSGVIDIVKDFQWAVTRNEDRSVDGDWLLRHARVGPHVVPFGWNFPGRGALDLLPAGTENRNYSASVDWDTFYEEQGGGHLLDRMRADMRSEYDYTLIDSRTGLSDAAAICTVHMPDILVACFTLSNQGIDGAAKVAAEVSAQRTKRAIRVLPVPSRVDDGEKEKADTGRQLARTRFAPLPIGLSGESLAEYWGSVEIPYRPFYAYEEILATFGDAPGVANSMLSAYERLAAYLTDGAVTSYSPVPEPDRLRILAAFTRRHTAEPGRILLSYASEARLWAEWIEATLKNEDIEVARFNPEAIADVQAELPARDRLLVVASGAYPGPEPHPVLQEAARGALGSGRQKRLAVARVTSRRLDEPFSSGHVFDLSGLGEGQAAEALFRALELPAPDWQPEPAGSGPRYPGNRPRIFSTAAPQRNPNFTGRDAALDALRDQLVAGTPSVLLPVALHGLGGVGKTQMALEYAYRYQSDYDLVWWVNAEHEETVVESLSQLAGHLGVPVGDNSTAAAEDAVQELHRRGANLRWLLIFDNADEPDRLARFLPRAGAGHTLVTSRNQGWAAVAKPLEVDVFSRQESMELLTRRVAALSAEEADRVAQALGDLPLAVEVAAAWLAVTGAPVDDYLSLLEAQTSVALSVNQPPTYARPVQATWNVSLERLRRRSPAAERMLQLCAFMAPLISLSLIRNREMVEVLRAFDPSLREKLLVDQVLQEIGRFALAKVDRKNKSVTIHRLVQAVIRDQMTEAQQEEALHTVHRVLVASWPDDSDTDNPENWSTYAIIWPHLEPSRALECVENRVRQLIVERVRYLYRIGSLEAALATATPVEATWNATLQAHREAIADADQEAAMREQLLNLRYEIANIERSRGDYQKAYNIDEDVLEQQTRMLGQTHIRTLMTARSLAADLRGLSRYEQALEMDMRTYEQFADKLGEDNAATLMAANNLAISYRLMGDCYTARDIDEKTHELRSTLLDDEHPHPHTLVSAGHLARDLREAGEYEASVTLLEATLRSLQQVLGKTLPETLRTAKSLAVSLRRAGHIDRAREMSKDTYELYEGQSQAETPDAFACLLNYAADLSVHEEKEHAVRETRRVLDAYESTYGPDHPYTLMCLTNLSMYERGTGQAREAAELAQRAHDGLQGAVGEEHPYTLCAALNLANALADLGRFEEALALETAAHEGLSRRLSPSHPDTVIAESNLSITLRALGRVREADQRLRRAEAAIVEKLGANHPNTEAIRNGMRINRDLEPQPI